VFARSGRQFYIREATVATPRMIDFARPFGGNFVHSRRRRVGADRQGVVTSAAPDPPRNPVVLYDGVCALCNRFVRFVLARDRAGVFRFASLQSDLARATLLRHGQNPDALSTLVLVLDSGRPSERLLDKSSAAAFVLSQLTGVWKGLGRVLLLVPEPLRNAAYDLVARMRYRTFGRYDVCPVPPPAVRDRFLD